MPFAGSTRSRLRTVNVGSSNLKATSCRLTQAETVAVRASAVRIGSNNSWLRVVDASNNVLQVSSELLKDQAVALARLCSWRREQHLDEGLQGLGHRLVHGCKY